LPTRAEGGRDNGAGAGEEGADRVVVVVKTTLLFAECIYFAITYHVKGMDGMNGMQLLLK
jgi:hypothetical protein